MLRVGRLVVALALALGGAVGFASVTTAHALLQAADPGSGARLTEAPTAVTLTFGEAPDPTLSSVKVLDTAGIDHAAGPASPVAGRPDELTVALTGVVDGVYTVAWRTVSSVDGHVAAGAYAFGVGVAPSARPATTGAAGEPADPLPATVARWLFYGALAALVGAAFVAFAVATEPSRTVVRMAVIGWTAAAIGTVAVIAVQWTETGAPLGTVLASSIGTGALARVVAIAVTGIALAWLLRRPPALRDPVAGVVLGLAAVTLLVDVMNGHAASGPATPVQVLAQWLHGLGAAIWIGGLTALLLAIRGQADEPKAHAVRRFSTAAAVALIVVAGSGLVRAIQEIGSVDALVTTDAGHVVLAKCGIFVCLAAMGAVNRFRNVPIAARTLVPLRRVGRIEVSLGVIVLLLSAALVNLAPPSAAANQPASPATTVTAVGHDFGTSVRMSLAASPGSAGFDMFDATLSDYDSGRPSDATGVALRFSLASQSGVGPSSLEMAPDGPGRFTASGSNLSIDGIWQVTATVSGPSGSVEVPLVMATLVPAQPMHSMVSTGAPTIDMVQVSDAVSVQAYLDPGTAGPNELHLTFFDAAGTELPVERATVALASNGGSAEVLEARLLEPGHFVVDTAPPAGRLQVDVVAPDPGGGTLHAQFSMEVEP